MPIDEAKEIAPVIFFGSDNRFVTDGEDRVPPQMRRTKDFRPIPVDADPRRTRIEEAGDATPKAKTSYVTEPVFDSVRDSSESQTQANPISQPQSQATPASVETAEKSGLDLIPPIGS